MRVGDVQKGAPFVNYTGTQAAIEALTGLAEGATAYATDLDALGTYTGAAWRWDVSTTVFYDSKDPTGWLAPDGIDVAYDYTTRKITLTGDLTYYWHGVKKSLTSPWTSDAHNIGQYYLYSTDGISFNWSATPWKFYHLMVAKAVYYAGLYTFGLRETHGLMQWQVHEELHETVSTFRESGGGLTAGTWAENNPTDAANSPGFDEAEVQDEDLHNTIPAWIQGTYTTMRIGAGLVATFDTTATLPFRHGASYLYVNDPATGAETAAANNRYLNVYQIIVPAASDTESQKYRMLMLQPQAQYTSLASAKAEDPRTLVFGDFTSTAPEFVIYSRITYVTATGDTNNGKCRIATGGVSYVAGTRLSQISVSGFVSPTAENVPFTPAGTIAATNVQAAIEEVATEAADLANATNPTTASAEFNAAARAAAPAETVFTIGELINSSGAKTTPADADVVGLMDSAAGNILKKLSWTNIKATLKTYFDGLYPQQDGWIPITGTWTRNDANKINVPSGAASIYNVGDKIRWKQGGAYKYGNIITIADTLLTIAINIDYTVTGSAGDALTDCAYSHAETPLGFPPYFNYAATLVADGGGTTPTINYARYKMLSSGHYYLQVQITMTATIGGSYFRLSLPMVSQSGTAWLLNSILYDVSAGSYQNAIAIDDSAGKVVFVCPFIASPTYPFTWATGDTILVSGVVPTDDT